jgi:hypothetical protein
MTLATTSATVTMNNASLYDGVSVPFRLPINCYPSRLHFNNTTPSDTEDQVVSIVSNDQSTVLMTGVIDNIATYAYQCMARFSGDVMLTAGAWYRIQMTTPSIENLILNTQSFLDANYIRTTNLYRYETIGEIALPKVRTRTTGVWGDYTANVAIVNFSLDCDAIEVAGGAGGGGSFHVSMN